jgi:hypothetical protein
MSRWFFFFIQAFGWGLVVYLVVGQGTAALNYDLAMSWGLQEPPEQITAVGESFFWGFAIADVLVYIPLLVVGLLGHLRGKPYGTMCLSAAGAISMYWTITCVSAVRRLQLWPPLGWRFPESLESAYWIVCGMIFLFGFFLFFSQFRLHVGPEKSNLLFTSFLISSGSLLGPVLFAFADLNGAAQIKDFSLFHNTISDLTRSGSPYWQGRVYFTLAAICQAGLGIGLLLQKRAGFGILVAGISNICSAAVFPQDVIGTGNSTPEGNLHILMVVVSVIAICQALVASKSFKTLIIVVLTGLLAFLWTLVWSGGGVPPYLGLMERLSVYTIQIWTLQFCVL